MIDNTLRVRITGDDKELKAVIDRSGRGLHGLASRGASAGSSLLRSFTPFTALLSGGAITLMTKQLADQYDQFGKLSERAGVTVEKFTALNYVAKQNDVTTEKLADAIKDLNERLVDAQEGGSETARVFEAMGVKTLDASGNLRTADDVLLDIADSFKSLPDGALKSTAAMKLMGESGHQMINMLNKGSDGIGAMTGEAERLGQVISQDTAESAAEFNDNLTRLQASMTGMANKVLPSMIEGINDLNEAMGNGAAKAAPAASDWLLSRIKEAQGEIGDLKSEIASIVNGTHLSSLWGRDRGDVQAEIEQQQQRILYYAELRIGAMEAEAAVVPANEKIAASLKDAMSGMVDSDESAEAYGKRMYALARQAYPEATKTAEEYGEEQKKVALELLASMESAEEYGKRMFELARIAYPEATESAEEYGERMAEVARQQLQVAKDSDQVAQIYKDTASSIRGAWRGAFRDILDGQNSFADRMTDIFKDLLADMATMAITQPIIIPMVQAFGGMMGVPGASQAAVIQQLGGGGGGGGLSLLGSAGSLGGSMGQFGIGFQGGFGGGFNVANAYAGNTSYATTAGGYAGAAAPFALAAGGGYAAGGYLSDKFGGSNDQRSANMAALGATIGMAVAGPIGAALGALAGTILGGVGRGDWETTGGGVNLDYHRGQLGGESFINEEQNGGWFHSDRDRTTNEALDSEIAGDLNFAFDNIEANLYAMADSLGISAKAVEYFTTSTSLSLHGLSEQDAAAAIDEWVSGVADDMASSLFGMGGFSLGEMFGGGLFGDGGLDLFHPLEYVNRGLDDFQERGETLYQTLQRLTFETATVDNVLDALGLDLGAMFDTLYTQAEYAIDLIDSAGGGDRLIALTNQYLKTFHTPEELIEKALTDATTSMNDMLGGIGAGRDGFRAQFEAVQGSLEPDDLVAWLEAASAITLVADLEKNLANIREDATTAAIVAASVEVDRVGGALSGMVEAFRFAAVDLAAIHTNLTEQIGGAQGGIAASISQILGASDSLSFDELRAQLGGGTIEEQIDGINGLHNAVVLRYDTEARLVEQAERTAEQAHQNRLREYEQLRDMANQLHGYVDDLLVSNLSPLTNEQRLNESKRQYGSLLLSARAGDTDALSSLQGASNTYLKEAQGFYASGSEYSVIFDSVRGELSSIADGLLSRPEPELSVAELAGQLLDLQTDAVTSLQKLGADLVDLQTQADDELQTGLDNLGEQFSIDIGSVVAGLKENADLTSAPIVEAMTKLEQQQADIVDVLEAIADEIKTSADQASADAIDQTDALTSLGASASTTAVA